MSNLAATAQTLQVENPENSIKQCPKTLVQDCTKNVSQPIFSPAEIRPVAKAKFNFTLVKNITQK
jgi:hypothetical protein